MAEKPKTIHIGEIPHSALLDLIGPVSTPVGDFTPERSASAIEIHLPAKGKPEARVVTRYLVPIHDGQYFMGERIRPFELGISKREKTSAKKRRVTEVKEPEKSESPFSALADTVIEESLTLQKLPERIKVHVHNALVDFAGVGVEAIGERWNSLSTDDQLRLTSRMVRNGEETAMDQLDAVSMLLLVNGQTEGRAQQQTLTAFRQLFKLIQTNSESVREYRNFQARARGTHVEPSQEGRQYHSRAGGGVPNKIKTSLGPKPPKKNK